MAAAKWCLPQIRFSPLKSSQVILLVLWLALSSTSCQPSVALPVFSASILHVPLSVAAIAFGPDGEIQIISSGNISSASFLSVHYMLPDCLDIYSGGGSGGAGGAQAPPTAVISMKPPLSLSYKFEKEEEGGKGLEEEEGEAAPPAMIPGSATASTPWC